MKHLSITLTGKVQRIGMRYKIMEYAELNNLRGYTRNLRDGNVYIEVEGDGPVIDKFLEWLKSSPGLSEVKNLETTEGTIRHFRDFQVF